MLVTGSCALMCHQQHTHAGQSRVCGIVLVFSAACAEETWFESVLVQSGFQVHSLGHAGRRR
jgi:hypothetical protein